MHIPFEVLVPSVLALGTILALLVERLTGWRAQRHRERQAPAETASSVASAASMMAHSIEQLLTPMRAEVVELRDETQALRREVVALRAVLLAHGIPHPLTAAEGAALILPITPPSD